jgi:hypothetical protein
MIEGWWAIASTPHTCDRMTTPLGTLWTKLCFCLIIVFYCLVCVLVNIFPHFLIRFHLVYICLHCKIFSCIIHILREFILKNFKLGEGLAAYLTTFSQGLRLVMIGAVPSHYLLSPHIAFTRVITGTTRDLFETR